MFVASYIYGKNPKKHANIRSRVDGFVAYNASFKRIEAFDNLICVYTLEHFSLIRYGVEIDPYGNIKDFII